MSGLNIMDQLKQLEQLDRTDRRDQCAKSTAGTTGTARIDKIDKIDKAAKLIVRKAHRIGSDLFLIKRLGDESLDTYYKRVGYISKKVGHLDTNKLMEFETLITNSIIWRNYVIYGMGYPSTVLNRI